MFFSFLTIVAGRRLGLRLLGISGRFALLGSLAESLEP